MAPNPPLTTPSHLWYTYFCRNRRAPLGRSALRPPETADQRFRPVGEDLNLERGQNDHLTRMVVLSERSEPKDLSRMPNKPHIAPKPFSFTHFPKNTSANRLESHTFKTTIRPGMVVLSE